MRVSELIATLRKLNPEAYVVVASDSEGNSHHMLDDVTLATIEDPNEYYLEVGDDGTSEDDENVFDHPAVIIYP